MTGKQSAQELLLWSRLQTHLFINALIAENRDQMSDLVNLSLARREDMLRRLNPLAYAYYVKMIQSGAVQAELELESQPEPVVEIVEGDYTVRDDGRIICHICGWKSRRKRYRSARWVYTLHIRGKRHREALEGG
jgi:hypothetical protein